MAAKMQQLQWKVGEFKITSIPETENPTGPQYIYHNLDKKSVQPILKKWPWIAPLFVTPQGNLILRIQSLIVDTGAHRILVDSCVGNDKPRLNQMWNKMRGDLIDRMAKAGYPPETITEVLCTHLHVDHCGHNTTLVNGKWVPTFKNAQYLFAQTEYEHWRSTPYDDDDPIFEDSVKPVMDAGLARLVEMNHQVCKGVALTPTPGHTPGHVSVVLESNGERAVITGDMIHNCLQVAEPTITSTFDWKPERAVQTRLDFLKKWTDGKTLIIGTHFANPTAGKLIDRGDNHWELDPGPEGARIAAAKAGHL